ncbi:MAG: AAA family ATPase [Planctomycetota bacterium]
MSDEMDVYLLAGQSNMNGRASADELPEVLRGPHATAWLYEADPFAAEGDQVVRDWGPLEPVNGGFGPELSFGHTVASGAAKPVALVKIARGGTGMFNDWRPTEPGTDALTDRAIGLAKSAVAWLVEQGYAPRWRGIVWYQGERDARGDNPSPELHGERLRVLMQRFREELMGGVAVPAVAFRVHPHNGPPENTPHYHAVRGAIMGWAAEDPAGAWVDVDDLRYPDDLHLDGASLLTAGDRAAAAMAGLPEVVGEAISVATVGGDDEVDAKATPEAAGPVPAPPTPDPTPYTPRPTPSSSPRIIALMNQKGGVGKTTTAVNVGAALASEVGGNHRVLLIDLDPQAHLTLSVGINPEELDASIYDLLADDDVTAAEVCRTVEDRPNLGVLPAETNLAGVEAELAPKVITGKAQTTLRDKTADLVKQFDYVLIDCPPALGLLTINALTLATEVVVPMQAHFLALQGMTKLFETVQMVQAGLNPALTVSGVVLCMHESQTLLAGEVIGEVDGFFADAAGQGMPWSGAVVYQPPIRRNIKLAEAPSFGRSVLSYAPDSNGAADYLALAASIAGRK